MHISHSPFLTRKASVFMPNRRQTLGWSLGLGLGLLQACAGRWPANANINTNANALVQHLQAAGPIDVLLLGEQHDAPEHHALHHAVIHAWGQAQHLSAVVLEMADAGHDTRGLSPQASAADVQARLAWSDAAWPWAAYGPAVMAAVAQGVVVMGGNLPRTRHREVMHDAAWDARVSPNTKQALETAVREGHCNLLPATQLPAMTRIQIARDVSMATAISQAHQPQHRTVIMLCGLQHADKRHGIPAHLPSTLRCHSVRLSADVDAESEVFRASGAYDTVWPTKPIAPKDDCSALKKQFQSTSSAP
jgi:uncharacterized iron-regulated protein